MVRGGMDTIIELAGQVQGGLAVVGIPSWIRRSAQPMSPRPMRRFVLDLLDDLLQRYGFHLDHVVQAADGEAHRALTARSRRSAPPGVSRAAELVQVDGAEVAGVVGASGCSPQGFVASIVSNSGSRIGVAAR